MAIGAHPDDIEFLMAGTLLQLKKHGYEIHYMNLSSGNCGSQSAPANRVRKIRRRESEASCEILGAVYHPSIADDLEIFYTERLLRKVAAIIRAVKPSILLTHSPQDYMEDHTNTCRLVVTGAFARGMPNFHTSPQTKPYHEDLVIYHSMPHGLIDGLRCRVDPDIFIDVSEVHDAKTQALAAHQSQKEWLDISQGMNSYLKSMEDMSKVVGKISKRFRLAEGWRRHSHLGFSSTESNPLAQVLGPRQVSTTI